MTLNLSVNSLQWFVLGMAQCMHLDNKTGSCAGGIQTEVRSHSFEFACGITLQQIYTMYHGEDARSNNPYSDQGFGHGGGNLHPPGSNAYHGSGEMIASTHKRMSSVLMFTLVWLLNRAG